MAFSAYFSDITETTADFSASFTGGDPNYNNYRYVKLTISGNTYQIRSDGMDGESSYFSYQLRGLTPGTDYDWTAQLGYLDGSTLVWLGIYDSGTFTTLSAITVGPWSWTSSNGSATSAQTRTAYNVLMGTVTANQFHHNVWNDLVDKTNEVLEAYGLGWSTSGGHLSRSQCYVSAGDTLSSDIYNGVRYNINRMDNVGIPDQVQEDPITGYKIYHLTEVLNDIIASL